jgi:hypothetical protein
VSDEKLTVALMRAQRSTAKFGVEYLPKMRAALTEAVKVVASGKLSLPITTTYKPSQIKEAIEHSQRGGKVLLDFNHPNSFS